MDFSYLRPPRNLNHLKYTRKQIQLNPITNKKNRILFQSSQYQPQQKQAIFKFKQYLKQRDPNKQNPDHILLKFCYMSNFHLPQTISLFKFYQEWHNNQQIKKLNPKSRKVLQSGVFYQYGRDPQYKPIIYFRPSLINFTKFSQTQYLNALNYFLSVIQQHMLIPDMIEKWILVIDFENKQIGLPSDLMQKYLGRIAIAFPERLQHLVIVNPHKNLPQLINNLKQKISSNVFNFETPKTFFCKNLRQLDRFVDSNQRQCKYGGSLQNLYQFWPIKSTNKLHDDSTLYPLMQSQTQFQSVVNDDKFFQQTNQTNLCCSKQQCIIM